MGDSQEGQSSAAEGEAGMCVSLVVAFDRNRAIGRDNALPWHLPADLKRFKQLTLGKPILMGRKTAESLGRALPGRRNLVLTRSGRVPFDGMQAVASLDDALQLADDDHASDLCVIGGGEVFATTLSIATARSSTFSRACVTAVRADATTSRKMARPARSNRGSTRGTRCPAAPNASCAAFAATGARSA
jgi:dihydrofolate reductase